MKEPLPTLDKFQELTMAAELAAFGTLSAIEFAEVISECTPQVQNQLIKYSNNFKEEYGYWTYFKRTQTKEALFAYKVKRALSELILENLKKLIEK